MDQLAYRTERIAVGVFYSLAPLRRALHDLEAWGIDRSDVNMLTDRRAIDTRFGGRVAPEAGPEPRRARVAWPAADDGVDTIRAWSRFREIDDDPAGPLLISDGPRTASLLCEDAEASTNRRQAIDRLRRLGLPVEVIERGAVLLWISVADNVEEKRVCTTLLRHSQDSVGVHDLGCD